MNDPLRQAILAQILHDYYDRVYSFALEVVKGGNMVGILTNSDKVQQQLDQKAIDVLNKYIEDQFGHMIEEYLRKYEENTGTDWSSYVYWTDQLSTIRQKT